MRLIRSRTPQRTMTKYTKAQAREYLHEKLLQRTAEEKSASQSAVYANVVGVLTALLQKKIVRHALMYTPIQHLGEIDISLLQQDFPEVSFDVAPRSSNGAFPDESYDCIFVPLYGWNSAGYRLGHGGGWYDKFLATQPQAVKIGVGLDDGLVEFATQSHDIPLDYIVTESRRGLL